MVLSRALAEPSSVPARTAGDAQVPAEGRAGPPQPWDFSFLKPAFHTAVHVSHPRGLLAPGQPGALRALLSGSQARTDPWHPFPVLTGGRRALPGWP